MSTITPDLSESFPLCPTYGFTSEPGLLVKVVAREGGFERRQRVWSRFLWKYTGVPSGDQPQEDILDIYDFWLAMGAISNGFRFKDWFDYKSCRITRSPTPLDQPIFASGDSPASYRLMKQYATKSGRTVQLREITRPIGVGYEDRLHTYTGIEVANETGVTQSDWTLDESTGLLIPGGSFSGVPTSWGGEFDVWCRFDAQFNPAISNFNIMNVTVQLAELRLPLA